MRPGKEFSLNFTGFVLKQTCATNKRKSTCMHDAVGHENVHARADDRGDKLFSAQDMPLYASKTQIQANATLPL
jgi:hypothetical protein